MLANRRCLQPAEGFARFPRTKKGKQSGFRHGKGERSVKRLGEWQWYAR
jgi:hypothetical protein